MQDFNSFVGDKNNENQNFKTVSDIANKFNGKSGSDILKAIYKEAEKGKRNGTLTNNDLDKFAMTLSSFLDDKKKKILSKLIEELKKI